MTPLRVAIDARAARTGAQEYVDATGRMRNASGQFVKSASSVDISLNRGAKSALRAARSIAAVQVALRAIGRITGGIGDAVDTIARFEETMATVGSVSGATALELERLTDTAKNLGATTRFSASEAGEGLLFLSRAGFSANESMQALPSTLDLAAAGGLELGRAADFASNILSQFGLSADQTTRVVDILINTSNRANTDVRQLAEAMKFAGPVAGSLGISAEATAAALGALGDSGLQSGIAGRNLRQIFLKLVNTTSEGAAVFERLGLTLDQVNPQTNSLATIFKTLRDSGLTAADAAKIFGAESAGAALILAKSTQKVLDLTQANKDAAGTARQVAEAMDNTLAGAIRSLKSSIESVIIATGDAGLKGSLRAIIETVTGAIRILNGMESEVDKTMVAARRLAMVVENLGFLIAGFITAKTILTVISFSQALLTASTSAKALTAALATNPIGLVTVALSVGIAALIKYRNEVVQIGDTTTTVGKVAQAVFEVIKRRATLAAEFLSIGFATAYDFITSGASELGVFFSDIFNGIKLNVDSFLERFGTNFLDLFDTLTQGWKNYGNFVIKLIRGIISAISQQIEAVKQAFQAITNFDINKPVESAKKALLALNKATNIGTVLLNSGKAISDELNSDTDYFEEAKKIGSQIGLKIKEGYETFVNSEDFKFLSKSFSDFFGPESVTKDFFSALNDLGASSNNAFMGVAQAVNRATGYIQEVIDSRALLNKGIEATNSALSTVSGFARTSGVRPPTPVNPIQEAIATTTVESPTQSIADKAREDISTAANEIYTLEAISGDVSNSFANNFSNAFDRVVEGTASIGQAFNQLAQDILKDLIKQLAVKSALALVNAGLGLATGGLSFAATGAGGLLGGLFGGANANGNAFYHGSVIPFANGGIFNSPVLFPMAQGKVGLMGEAGPEAILPLARNGRGQLGVRAEGGGQNEPQQIIQQTINFNVRSPDADSFRRSQRQIRERLLGEIGF